MTVGEQIRARREYLSMSQDQLGEAAGVSGRHIRYIEDGEKSPTVETLARIAAALRTSFKVTGNGV